MNVAGRVWLVMPRTQTQTETRRPLARVVGTGISNALSGFVLASDSVTHWLINWSSGFKMPKQTALV
jgi:hypothetical protein